MRQIETTILNIFNEPNCQTLTKKKLNYLIQVKLHKDSDTKNASYSYVSASINRLVQSGAIVKVDRGLYTLASNKTLSKNVQDALNHLDNAKLCIDLHETNNAKQHIDHAIEIIKSC